MRRGWVLDDLIASWTLVDVDLEVLGGKHSATRLSFAVMLTFFEIEGRFLRHAGEVPPAAVDYLARQLGLDAGEASPFEVVGRTAQRHWTQIRDLLAFRVFSRGDEDKMIGWLADEVCPTELNEDRQREAVRDFWTASAPP